MTMRFSNPDDVKAITPLNPFNRLADGRPKVSDEILERMKDVTTEEAWRVVDKHGYKFQVEQDWLNMHPDRVMVGRALTCTMVPLRPDLNDVVDAVGAQEGRHGSQNNWVIHMVGERDVLVVNLFGKVKWGTFVGDNLSTAIWSHGGSGMVIDGGIRDTQRIYDLPNINVFCRGVDPTPIRDVTLVNINGPARIGQATCMPGDVVLGTRGGLVFIPPHLAEEVVTSSEDVRLRDRFGQQRIKEGKYSSGEIDVSEWEPHIEEDFQQWMKQR